MFARQFGIAEIGGAEGQKKLADSKVLVIGAGGLGAPVITYLASAGVGTIYIADGDVVEETNLNRQFLHTIKDIGRNKAKSASEKARLINGASKIAEVNKYLSGPPLHDYIKKVDCVVDCIDSYEVRKEVGRACLRVGVPLVEAGVSDLYGWMLCVDREHACLECAGLREFVQVDSPAVLGASVGMVGSAQAIECIKILLDSPDVNFGRFINFDGRRMEIESMNLEVDAECEAHNYASSV
jgi:adenylyltransferase/sulfurtransferase